MNDLQRPLDLEYLLLTTLKLENVLTLKQDTENIPFCMLLYLQIWTI